MKGQRERCSCKDGCIMKRILIKVILLFIAFTTACDNEENGEEQFPNAVDLRETGNFTKVRDQGNLGSCWAFACIGLTEYLLREKYEVEVDLSEQQLINCAGFGPSDGLDYLLKHGITTEEKLPYQAKILDCDENIEVEYGIDDVEMIKLDVLSFDERIQKLKSLLANKQPFITHFDLYVDFDLYKTGIYEYDGSSESNNGHIVLVVGYVNDASVKNGGYWIGRNSWGSKWGENGYFRIPYDECNIATGYAYAVSEAIKIEKMNRLSVNGYHCRWSADGEKIAYTKSDNTGVKIAVYYLKTKEEKIIVDGMNGDLQLTWLDKGTSIAFDAYDETNQSDIWKVNIDSGTKTKLIDNAFLPDAHASQDELVCVHNGTLSLFKKSGEFIKNINNITGSEASISPDGTKIALVSEESGNEDVWVINLDGTDKKQITNFQGRDYWPRWSPDGTMIAYESKQTGNFDIWVYQLQTGKQIQLTTTTYDEAMGDWSPNGQSMVIISNKDGGWGIYTLSAVF